jgi:hypothetical protein
MYKSKYRIRWYGEAFGHVTNPILECKIKYGLIGLKKSYQLNDFDFKTGINAFQLIDLLNNSEINAGIKSALQNQIPVSFNRYSRKYFISCDKNIRITLDNDLSFYRINNFDNNFLQKRTDKETTIIEVKYKKELESEASRITNELPFRLAAFSKYSKSVELIY